MPWALDAGKKKRERERGREREREREEEEEEEEEEEKGPGLGERTVCVRDEGWQERETKYNKGLPADTPDGPGREAARALASSA